ncbi:MAG: hypothetical protein LBQ84_06065 [Flavobacteriaceae bacterium]|jgi:hypothetical protein|nr:hypothetical protein [Flavobacteriaceae bacterium]
MIPTYRVIKIEWVDSLRGDYSFKDRWNYPENIFKNSYNQLVCDGLCNPEADKMRDKKGKIRDKYLKEYYQLVDTTHIFHTVESEAQCYEWNGTDEIVVKRIDKNTVECYTLCNVATHSSLELTLTNDQCFPKIKLQSVSSSGTHYYDSKDGYIKIDRPLWDKGIMKAEFHFYFIDPENPEKDMWWKGKIYSKIN